MYQACFCGRGHEACVFNDACMREGHEGRNRFSSEPKTKMLAPFWDVMTVILKIVFQHVFYVWGVRNREL